MQAGPQIGVDSDQDEGVGKSVPGTNFGSNAIGARPE